MSYDRNKVIDLATSEVGYLEKSKSAYSKNSAVIYQKTAGAGYDNITKYGYEMHQIYPSVMDFPAAWCDAFVDWLFYKSYGVATAKSLLGGNFDDYTVESAKMYRNHNALDNTPEVGSQIFFSKSTSVNGVYHTGLVIAVSNDKKTVTTIEGNTSATGNNVEANGGAVAKKTRSVSKYTFFGHPAYNDGGSSMKPYTGTINTNTSNLMVRTGPGASYSVVECFPSGLPKGTKVGIDKEENGWGRLAGTAWWLFLQWVKK